MERGWSKKAATISASPAQDLVGEWTFSEAAFGPIPDNEERFLKFVCGRSSMARRASPIEELRQARALVSEFLDGVVEKVLSLNPQIVGCSSTFEQNCASLALLRRIKERDPDTTEVIMLTGDDLATAASVAAEVGIGQVVAISHPDSSLAPRVVTEFKAVERIEQLSAGL